MNGDFETGDFTGWTQFGDTSFTSVSDEAPYSGVYAASFGPGTPGGISQTLSTVVGATYHVGFWLQNEEDVFGDVIPNSFDFSWGGVSQLSLTDATLLNYTPYTFDLVATSTSTDLTFTFTNDPAFWDLDAVTVPEPDTLALLAIAGGLAALQSRRRRGA